jgi:hypothetical protein
MPAGACSARARRPCAHLVARIAGRRRGGVARVAQGLLYHPEQRRLLLPRPWGHHLLDRPARRPLPGRPLRLLHCVDFVPAVRLRAAAAYGVPRLSAGI